jgi:regulator of replication initiation timing
MKAYIIETGHFSQAGNFIGYSSTGERIHIYKKQIFKEFPMVEVFHRHNGNYDKEWMTFPFYCLAEHLSFNSTEGQEFTRLTAEQISVSKFKLKLSLMDGCQEWSKRDADRSHSIEWCFNDLDKQYTKLKEECAKLALENEKLKDENDRLRDEVNASQWDYEHSKLERDGLKEENEKLKDYFKALQWENEHIQSERERLALIIMNASKVVASCDLGLSQDKINQLINNA